MLLAGAAAVCVEEPFSLTCVCSHSLAALIASVRASVGVFELPLKMNLLRSFHIVQRIHGKIGMDTRPVGGRQGFAHRAVHLSSKSTIPVGSNPVTKGAASHTC